jgi:predicted MFS family arabinose efflux permease
VSTLFGVVFLSHQLGAFMGAWLSGLMYEANGNYDLVWWISIGLGVGASLIHLPIREEVSEQMSGAKTSGNQVIGA